jgi:type I restriction enzyme R subunit
MTLDNIIVRPKRKHVEKYSNIDSWKTLSVLDTTELGVELAGLPSQLQDTEEEAKRFDMMVLRTQLCVLNGDIGFDKYKKTIQSIASALELQDSIPAIRAQMPLIQSLSEDDWWQDVTVTMLEQMRKSLRLLVKLIEKKERVIVYTNFDDAITGSEDVGINFGSNGLDYEKFKLKSRDFLRLHEDKLAVAKLRTNKPITPTDLKELEIILLEQAGGDNHLIEQAKQTSGGLGLFVRSLLGLERGAAMDAMAEFLNDRNATSSQHEFVTMIVNYLTQDGVIERGRLYEAPFTSITATGPDSIFDNAKVVKLFNIIDDIKLRAVA